MKRAFLLLSALLVWGCQGSPSPTEPALPSRTLRLPTQPHNYAQPALPPFFSGTDLVRADNMPSSNPTTDPGATLGRVLFYDETLSGNRTTSCASCHKIARGFDDDKPLSTGFAGGQTRRNSMALANARFYPRGRFLWDERAETLEAQALLPFQDPVEMGLTLDELVARVQGETYYPPLFEAAFGDPAVTADRISRALAQFIRSMVSYRSRYDQGRAQVTRAAAERFPNFTEQENLGRRIFFGPDGRCSQCHTTDAFVLVRPHNTGLDAATTDAGLQQVTGVARDAAHFKAPSLRNAGLRTFFMHDGRFTTLEEVVEFYNSGVQAHPNLDPALRFGSEARRLGLTVEEKAALVAFLHTLTDYEMVNDPKFSDPFVRR